MAVKHRRKTSLGLPSAEHGLKAPQYVRWAAEEAEMSVGLAEKTKCHAALGYLLSAEANMKVAGLEQAYSGLSKTHGEPQARKIVTNARFVFERKCLRE